MSDEATNQMKGWNQDIWFLKIQSRKGKPKDSIDSSHSDSTTLDVGVFPAHAGVFLNVPLTVYWK